MIKFDKLSSEETRRLGKKLIGCLSLIAILITVSGASHVLSTSRESLSISADKLESLSAEYNSLEAQIAEMTEELSTLKTAAAGSMISKEELVIMLGDCARNSGVSLIGLSSRDVTIEDSIAKYNFNFELKGTMSQIADTLANIDSHKLHYAINELSLRQEADYLWLQRNFEEQITWWDLSNVTTAGGFQSNAIITASDIIQDDTMTLYLDVDFIFVTDSEDTESEDTESTPPEIGNLPESTDHETQSPAIVESSTDTAVDKSGE